MNTRPSFDDEMAGRGDDLLMSQRASALNLALPSFLLLHTPCSDSVHPSHTVYAPHRPPLNIQGLLGRQNAHSDWW